MAEMADVVGGNAIQATWGNQVRDRSVQRYSNEASRDSLHATPVEGDLAYIQDINKLQFYDGSNWLEVLNLSSSDALTANLDAGSFKVTNLSTAGAAGDAMSQGASDARYLKLVGGSLTGSLDITGAGDDLTIDGSGTIGRAMLIKSGSGSNNVAHAYIDFASDVDTRAARIRGSRGSSSQQSGLLFYGYNSGLVLSMEIGPSGEISFPGAGTTTDAGTPSWRHFISGDRTLNAMVSSQRFKRNRRPLDVEALAQEFQTVPLQEWQEKGSPKDSEFIRGVTAEDIAEVPGLAKYVGYDEEGPLSFDPVTGLHIHMAAALQYALNRLDALEA